MGFTVAFFDVRSLASFVVVALYRLHKLYKIKGVESLGDT